MPEHDDNYAHELPTTSLPSQVDEDLPNEAIDTSHPDDDDDDTLVDEPEAEAGTRSAATRKRILDLHRSLNQLRRGTLVAHHPARDVLIPADGDGALRMISWFAGTVSDDRLDMVHPDFADATNGWTVLTTTDLIGLTWIPDPPRGSGRVVVDPTAG